MQDKKQQLEPDGTMDWFKTGKLLQTAGDKHKATTQQTQDLNGSLEQEKDTGGKQGKPSRVCSLVKIFC